jgi:hypothetical protein
MKKPFYYFSSFMGLSVPTYFLLKGVDKIAPVGSNKSVILRLTVIGLWIAGSIYLGKKINEK